MKKAILKNEDIGSICMALYHLQHAGVAVGDAFTLLAEDESLPAEKKLLQSMAELGDSGAPVSEIFRSTERFPHYVCSLLELGEKVGKTEDCLLSLARYYEGRGRLEKRLRSALLYPAALALTMLMVVVILIVFVLPVFNDVYIQLGSSLTGFAGALLSLGGLLRGVLPFFLALIALIAIFAACAAAFPAFRDKCAALWRRLRGDRGIWRIINEARFAQALSMAMESGFAPLEASELAASLSGDSGAFSARCAKLHSLLAEGETLPKALRETELMSKSRCRLLEAGMKSGQGENVMRDLSEKMLEDGENAVENALGRIEPVMIVVLSLMVGAILLSVMLPLMNIMSAIS